jgi:hypothetical protein
MSHGRDTVGLDVGVTWVAGLQVVMDTVLVCFGYCICFARRGTLR